MKRLLTLTLMLALGLALAQPVKIGILSPLTGGAAGTGQAQLEGFELALQEINDAGGILGEPLEIVVEDTKADAQTALAAFEKLMTEDEVGFIAGGYSSGVTLGLVESFKTFQPVVTWIGGAVSGVGLDGFEGIEETLGSEEWFFHIHPWDYHNTAAANAFIASADIETVAILHEDSAFGGPGAATAARLLEEQGIEVTLNEAFKSTLLGGTGDFRAAISKAKATGADMLYWIGYDSDVVPMSSQIRELNYNPAYIFGTPPGWPSGFAEASEAQCVTGLIGFLPNLPTSEAQTFSRDYQAMHGKAPENYMAALAYAQLWAYADAINSAGSTDREGVIDALEQGTFRSPAGDWSFGPSEISQHQGFSDDLWLVFQYQDGVREIVFPLERSTAPLRSCN
ncbi:MAG: ABC transporter substrate-binding protein [Trueperaceae bacterium]